MEEEAVGALSNALARRNFVRQRGERETRQREGKKKEKRKERPREKADSTRCSLAMVNFGYIKFPPPRRTVSNPVDGGGRGRMGGKGE